MTRVKVKAEIKVKARVKEKIKDKYIRQTMDKSGVVFVAAGGSWVSLNDSDVNHHFLSSMNFAAL